ncbi:MAG TPA: Replication factor C small subunit, partial [Methanocorpusculum sp.]|nr:Replication factor C small subunit [Methanocorpusculum sp.]
AITYISQGDMRKAINALQGAAIVSNVVTADNVYAITSNAKPEEIEDLVSVTLSGDFETAERTLRTLMYDRGIAPNELLNQMYRTISSSKSLDRSLKVSLIDHLGETDFRLSEGADADIQMDALLARFVKTGLSS